MKKGFWWAPVFFFFRYLGKKWKQSSRFFTFFLRTGCGWREHPLAQPLVEGGQVFHQAFVESPSSPPTVDGDSNVLREQKYCYISNSQTDFVVCPAPPPQNRWRFVKIWNLDFRSHFKQNIHHGQKNNVWFWFLKSMASKYVFLEGIHVSLMMCSFI